MPRKASTVPAPSAQPADKIQSISSTAIVKFLDEVFTGLKNDIKTAASKGDIHQLELVVSKAKRCEASILTLQRLAKASQARKKGNKQSKKSGPVTGLTHAPFPDTTPAVAPAPEAAAPAPAPAAAAPAEGPKVRKKPGPKPGSKRTPKAAKS